MMKSLLSTLSMAVILAVPSHALAWENLEEMNHVIDHSNFIVGDGCSGTLISVTDRLIVTAGHCVSNKVRTVTEEEVGPDGKITKVQYKEYDHVRVSQRNYSDFEQTGEISYITEIVGYAKEDDLALLQLVGDDLRSDVAARVIHEDEKLMRGQAVIAVGNPRMLDASVTEGVISSLNRTIKWVGGEEVPMIQYDAAGAPGSSGGALFAKDTGAYIGTTVGGRQGEFTVAIPYFTLYELLDEACFAELYDPEANDAECRESEDPAP